MPTNTESLNRELFRLLSKYKPKPLDAEGKVTPIPDEADIFKFEFTKDGKDYGTVYVTLDEDRVLTVYFGDDVANSPDDKTPKLDYNDTWSGLLHQLSAWRMTKGLKGFNTQNKDRVGDDMARRNHMRNKDKIAEGYYATGKKSSYSDAVPSVKIVIEHSRVIEEGEQRYRNINRIFLENQAGERYLLDTKKPGIARVYARHIAEGGKVNDDRWSHIGNLCEEYQKMAGFVRATRNGQFNESAQSLVNEGIAHYQSLRESLSRMTGKRGYNVYFENWTPALMEDGTEENNLNELFVQETLDPRIESVMPILNRIHKKVSESVVDKEMNKLAEWADSLVEEGGESLTSNNPIGIPEEQGVSEGSNQEKVEVRFSAKEYAAMSPAQKAAKQEELQQLKQQAKKRLQTFTLIDTDKERDPNIDDQGRPRRPGDVAEGSFKQTSSQRQYEVLHSQLKSLANSGQINTPAGKQKAEKMIDTIQQLVDTDPSCAGSTVPSKKIWLSEQGVAEGSVTPNITVNKVHDDGHEKEWHIYRGKEMIGYVIKNQPDTAEGLYIAYGHGPGRAFVGEFTGLKPAVNYIASLKEGVAEGSLNEGQYEMMMRNGQVKKFIAKDDADAKRIAAGHGAKSVIKLKGGVPAGKVAEQGVAEMAGIEETHPAVRQLKNKLGQVAKQNPGSGLGRHYDNIKNGMTYKSLVNKGMVDQNGQINIPGFKDDDKEKEVDEQAPGWARHLGGAALGAATGAGGAFAGAPLGPLGMAAGGALAGANGYELGMKGVDAVWDKFSGKKPDAPLLHQTKDAFGREQTAAGNDVAEGTGSSIERILAAHPEAVENFKQGGDLDYDLESDLWEYYYNNGEIRNYDADASEFISQSLADELGLSEGLDANQKRVGQLGPTKKVKNNNIGKLVGANENFINTVDQAVVSEEDEMAESILSAIKKVIDTVAPGDEKLLKQLDKDVHGNKVPNRYNSDAESAKKYPADSWKAKVDESSDELARILTIMNHRR